jgi:protein SCO1
MKHPFIKLLFLGTILIYFIAGCRLGDRQLPIVKTFRNGDSVAVVIPNFSFINQDSKTVTQDNFKDKIYVADFFFTTCPTICPVMKKEMLRVHERFKNNPDVVILSHSIDPRHDSVVVLKEYAARLGVKSDKWHFVTGDRKKIFEIGEKFYNAQPKEDSTAPGGLIHNAAFILIDKKRQVRKRYDGVESEQVDKLMDDIEILLKEKNNGNN